MYCTVYLAISIILNCIVVSLQMRPSMKLGLPWKNKRKKEGMWHRLTPHRSLFTTFLFCHFRKNTEGERRRRIRRIKPNGFSYKSRKYVSVFVSEEANGRAGLSCSHATHTSNLCIWMCRTQTNMSASSIIIICNSVNMSTDRMLPLY